MVYLVGFNNGFKPILLFYSVHAYIIHALYLFVSTKCRYHLGMIESLILKVPIFFNLWRCLNAIAVSMCQDFVYISAIEQQSLPKRQISKYCMYFPTFWQLCVILKVTQHEKQQMYYIYICIYIESTRFFKGNVLG